MTAWGFFLGIASAIAGALVFSFLGAAIIPDNNPLYEHYYWLMAFGWGYLALILSGLFGKINTEWKLFWMLFFSTGVGMGVLVGVIPEFVVEKIAGHSLVYNGTGMLLSFGFYLVSYAIMGGIFAKRIERAKTSLFS